MPDSYDSATMPLKTQPPSTFLSCVLGAWTHPWSIPMVTKCLLYHVNKGQKEEGAKGKNNRRFLDGFLIVGSNYTTYHCALCQVGDTTSPQINAY